MLVWLLPIFSGVCDAASRNLIKTTKKVHGLSLVAAGFIFALPYYAAWLAWQGIPEVGPAFLPAVALHVPLVLVANVLLVEAHRSSPMLLTMPLLALTPALTLVSAPLMGGGEPTRLGSVGVIAIVVGLYILNIKKDEVGWFGPIRSIAKDRGTKFMLVVNVIFAITSNLDYIALENANESFYLLVDHGLAGVTMAGVAVIYGVSGRANTRPPRGSVRTFALFGSLVALGVAGQMLAFRFIPMVPYVIALKRSGGIFFATSYALTQAKRGHPEYDGELENVGARIVGAATMLAGMLLVILWGKE